jgi:hypothetical protein
MLKFYFYGCNNFCIINSDICEKKNHFYLLFLKFLKSLFINKKNYGEKRFIEKRIKERETQ